MNNNQLRKQISCDKSLLYELQNEHKELKSDCLSVEISIWILDIGFIAIFVPIIMCFFK